MNVLFLFLSFRRAVFNLGKHFVQTVGSIGEAMEIGLDLYTNICYFRCIIKKEVDDGENEC